MFGGNSPVIIILNEKHQRERNFDADAMRQRFSNIQDILSVDLSSDDHKRLKQIRLAIRQKISALPHVGSTVPGKWIDIRDHLEAMPDNTITHDNYIEICKQYGITNKKDALILSQYFHDIGVLLHFQRDAILKHTLFLKPNWATNAIYKVLDDVNLQQQGGVLLIQQAKAIWHEAEFIDLCDEFLQLMQKFHLAFALKKTLPSSSVINNSENQPQYIVPAKLPTKQPDYSWASQHDNQNDSQQNIMLRYKYDEFMPKGLLFHLMVELHHLIDSKDDVWRRGMLLHKNNATADVIEAYAARDIKIRIKGQNGRDLLIIIMDKLDEINRQYNKLKVEKLIPCHCNICQPLDEPHFYEYSDLELRQISDQATAECKKSYKPVNVAELLNSITATAQPDVSKTTVRDQVFISYSHKDVDMLETIQTHFKVLENEGINIKLWDDSAINAGDQWFEEIKSNLAKTKVFVLLISTDFLASEFIAKHELPSIIEAMEDQGATILSLILKPCRYTKHKVLKKIQSINKPDRPLSGLSEHEQDQEILKLIEAIETNQLSDK